MISRCTAKQQIAAARALEHLLQQNAPIRINDQRSRVSFWEAMIRLHETTEALARETYLTQELEA